MFTPIVVQLTSLYTAGKRMHDEDDIKQSAANYIQSGSIRGLSNTKLICLTKMASRNEIITLYQRLTLLYYAATLKTILLTYRM